MLVPRPRSRSSYLRGGAFSVLPTEDSQMSECKVNGCNSTRYTERDGLCRPHYRKLKKYGDPEYVKPPKAKLEKPCPVDGCPKGAYRKGYCYGHYMKVWRYGTPEPVFPPKWEDVAGARFGMLRVTNERDGRFWVCRCDCGATVKRDVGNLRRTGDTNTCGIELRHYDPGSGYGAAHDRVKRTYGPASSHACTDCSGPAYHWSYDHEDPNERLHEYAPGRYAAYSHSPDHYQPRCVPCHKRYDLGRRDARVA